MVLCDNLLKVLLLNFGKTNVNVATLRDPRTPITHTNAFSIKRSYTVNQYPKSRFITLKRELCSKFLEKESFRQ